MHNPLFLITSQNTVSCIANYQSLALLAQFQRIAYKSESLERFLKSVRPALVGGIIHGNLMCRHLPRLLGV